MLGGSESRAGSSAGKDDVRNAGSAAEDGGRPEFILTPSWSV
jgi:hypothetical protein